MQTETTTIEAAALPERPHTGHLDLMECPLWLLQRPLRLFDEHGDPVEAWETESAWFTATEAEAWREAHAYRTRGWRVFGVAARGDLMALLSAYTAPREERPRPGRPA